MSTSAIAGGVSASLEPHLRSLDNLRNLPKEINTAAITDKAKQLQDVGTASRAAAEEVKGGLGQILDVKA